MRRDIIQNAGDIGDIQFLIAFIFFDILSRRFMRSRSLLRFDNRLLSWLMLFCCFDRWLAMNA